MYTLIKRTVPPPAMAIFDASNRDICEVKRLRTNTPLQALVMLNDPTVLEASRVLAAKLLADQSAPKERIATAFRLIVSRRPSEKEIEVLLNYYSRETGSMDEVTAKKTLAVGEYPLPEKYNAIELAAMMRVVSTIYNLEETVTKS